MYLLKQNYILKHFFNIDRYFASQIKSDNICIYISTFDYVWNIFFSGFNFKFFIVSKIIFEYSIF